MSSKKQTKKGEPDLHPRPLPPPPPPPPFSPPDLFPALFSDKQDHKECSLTHAAPARILFQIYRPCPPRDDTGQYPYIYIYNFFAGCK